MLGPDEYSTDHQLSQSNTIATSEGVVASSMSLKFVSSFPNDFTSL